MAVAEETKPKILMGASIPRSGHHYLQRLLSRYFHDEMFYCEWYTPANCCKTVPCTRGSRCRVTYQKSHDWEFGLRQDVADALYIVQFRQPVPEALSDRELSMRDSMRIRSFNYRITRDHYSWWLATKAIYYRKFHDKWFRNGARNFFHVNYDDLLQRPADVLEHIVRWVCGGVDPERLTSAIAEISVSRGLGPAMPVFAPRVIETSRYFDRDLLAPFEAYVLRHCPVFQFKSQLDGSYEDHWLYGLILLQDPDEPLPEGEDDRLDAAARRAPDHPEVLFRLAEREIERGFPERAIPFLETAIARSPFFGQAYRLLMEACKAAGRPIPTSCTSSDILFACTEDSRTLIEIAVAMLNEERFVNAATVLSLAIIIQPDSHRANHFLAKALSRLGRWSQAREYVEKALELRPNNKESKRLLANITKHLGSQRAAA